MADQNQPQALLAHMLLERVRQDAYPSTTQMDMLEQLLTPDMLDEYVDVLLEKAFDQAFPSIPMLRRIQRLVTPM